MKHIIHLYIYIQMYVHTSFIHVLKYILKVELMKWQSLSDLSRSNVVFTFKFKTVVEAPNLVRGLFNSELLPTCLCL